ncbi:MAG: FHA domain-containing protein [Polyangiales bacterium]
MTDDMVMTTQDQNKKTLRHFQCRDYLWEVFEQMSTELECSTDYLINEAMRQYARSRNYGTARNDQRDEQALTAEPPAPAAQPSATSASNGGIPSLRDSQVARASNLPTPPPPRTRTATPGTAAEPRSPQSSPDIAQSGIAALAGAPRPARAATAGSLPPLPPPPPRPRVPGVSNPPPIPGPPPARSIAAPPQPSAPVTTRPRQLFIIFNGQKIPVNKEEFVIGRGSKSADLAIKDGNISRRHAAVVLQNGAHFLRDLGSTNGVEFQGRRFDSKKIEEGDLFRICDYELRFTYQ